MVTFRACLDRAARREGGELVAMNAAKSASGTGDEGADQHRESGEERDIGGGLARRIGLLAQLRLRPLDLVDHLIDPLGGIYLAEAGISRHDLGEVGLIGGGKTPAPARPPKHPRADPPPL